MLTWHVHDFFCLAFLAHSGIYLVHLLDSILLGRSSSLGELHGLTNHFVRYFLREELHGLLKALAELVRLDIPVIGIYFNH